MTSSSFQSLLKLSVPATLQLLVDWCRPLLFNIFVSRNLKRSTLSTADHALELDAVSLAVMSLNLLCFATAYGFNGSIDAYAAVAYGAGDRKELFAVLYRQMIMLLVMLLMAVCILTNAEPLLLLTGQSVSVSQRTAAILQRLLLSVAGDFAYDCLGRWMRNQQMNTAVSMCSFCALATNLSVNFLCRFEDPLLGPILGLTLQNCLLPFLLLATYCQKQSLEQVPSSLISRGMADQCKTGIASAVWTCSELWAWEAQIFEASGLGTGQIASYALLSSIYSLLIMVPVGVSFACNALAGEALGKQDTARAAELVRQACWLALSLVSGYAVLVVLARQRVANLLGGGVPAVETTLATLLPLLMIMHLGDGLFNVLKGWLTIRKQQFFGASMTLFIYYCVALPTGYGLAFHAGFGLMGLWLGLGLAVFIGTAIAGAQVYLDLQKLGGTKDSYHALLEA